jgi:hypothetical protein
MDSDKKMVCKSGKCCKHFSKAMPKQYSVVHNCYVSEQSAFAHLKPLPKSRCLWQPVSLSTVILPYLQSMNMNIQNYYRRLGLPFCTPIDDKSVNTYSKKIQIILHSAVGSDYKCPIYND